MKNHISSRVLILLLAGLVLDSQHKNFFPFGCEKRGFHPNHNAGIWGEVLQFQELWGFSFLGVKDGWTM